MKRSLYVLGIHNTGPIASCVIIKDGHVLAGSTEERFSRIKQDQSFPHRAIDFSLKFSGIALKDIDIIAVGWNPGENVALKYRKGFSDWMRYPGEWLSSVPNHLLPLLAYNIKETTSNFKSSENNNVTIMFIDHHLCHARLAYDVSGFNECAILVADGWSEQKATSLMYANKNKIETIKSEEFPNSIGCFYATLTEFLGYKPFSDEWKVMGMAAYGYPSRYPQIKNLIKIFDKGKYELNISYFNFYNFDKKCFFSRKMELLLGPARKPYEELTQRHFDIAAAGQALFEKVMNNILVYLRVETGSNNLALSGGVAMNCLYNGKIVGTTGFSRCSISFAPDDSGNAIGAAFVVSARLGIDIRAKYQTSCIGVEYSDIEIQELLESYNLPYKTVNDIAKETAFLLSENKVVAWFQGRSEFGQRALGHRSIFASPKNINIKEKINRAIKFREQYRPFAPMIKEEDIKKIFETKEDTPVRYMEKAFKFRREAINIMPAVVHKDRTGRPQSVSKRGTPLLFKLLSEFEQFTDCPAILNTSFNLNGEPIVNTPDDALKTFVTSGLDVLIIGKYKLEKDKLLSQA